MNKVIKVIFEALVYSNVWISLGAVSFAFTASILQQYVLSTQFVLFIFSTTLFTYNFQRLVKIHHANAQPISGPRAEWMKRNMTVVYCLTLASLVGGVVFGSPFFKAYYLLFFIVGFFSFFYVWRLPLFKSNIRSIPGIKIFILAITWMLATGAVPFLIFSHSVFSVQTSILCLSLFLFIISISIPFDIRDVEIDNERLKTIPQILGVNKSRLLSVIVLIASTIFMLFFSQYWNTGIMLSAMITGTIIYNSAVDRNELFYSGLVDSTLIIQYLCIYLLA